jgi:hypothetical protein
MLHRTIPGSNPSVFVKGENAIGHGVDNLINKINVPNAVGI